MYISLSLPKTKRQSGICFILFPFVALSDVMLLCKTFPLCVVISSTCTVNKRQISKKNVVRYCKKIEITYLWLMLQSNDFHMTRDCYLCC